MTHENYRQKSLFELDGTYHDEADSEPDLPHHTPTEMVGPSVPLGEHFLNSQQMMKEVLGANRGRYFVMKNTTSQGFDATVQQYGSVSTAIGVSINTGRRAARLQSRMDKLFQVEELITAGFAAKAVREASKKLTAELTAKYTGTHNETARAKRRREIAESIKILNERMAIDS